MSFIHTYDTKRHDGDGGIRIWCSMSSLGKDMSESGDDTGFFDEATGNFGVFDGVGGGKKKYGKDAPRKASRSASKAFKSQMREMDSLSFGNEREYNRFMRRVKEHMDDDDVKGSTTAVAGRLVHDKRRLYHYEVYCVGDSEARHFRFQDDGSFSSSSSSSSSSSYSSSSSSSSSSVATSAFRQCNATRAMRKVKKGRRKKNGTWKSATESVSALPKTEDHEEYQWQIKNDDVIVVGSDGFWDNWNKCRLTRTRCESLLLSFWKGFDPSDRQNREKIISKSSRELVKFARSGPKTDDIFVSLIYICC